MMIEMRGHWLAIGLLTGATVFATLLCPCTIVNPPATADAHGCCPVEPGLRAATPSCCAATAAPEPGTWTPATAGPALPLPTASVLVALPVADMVTADAPQAVRVAASPPLVLRI
ncbi:MAG TPA: hypothetical protein VFQ51_10805 [Vicinamibacteria bacterium]|nr:hypothetical protein [Vicinamibacteria bacterium]